MSVVIGDDFLARHLSRVVGPDGAVISEHAALAELGEFLHQHHTALSRTAD
jgi:hypothetical protein